MPEFLCRQLTPLGQGSGPVLLENIAAVEVTVLIDRIVYPGVSGGEFLKGFDVYELGHRALSSTERLV